MFEIPNKGEQKMINWKKTFIIEIIGRCEEEDEIPELGNLDEIVHADEYGHCSIGWWMDDFQDLTDDALKEECRNQNMDTTFFFYDEE